ncbi:MAG: transcription antitermination factor NusB [Dethiobacter sp.]|nr:MAG: transcription antitermination factor NusB [Dethiobacter sp.]
MKRRLSRECAFKALFMIDLGNNNQEGALNYVLRDAGLSEKEQLYCVNLVKGVLGKKKELDEILSGYLVNWQFDRLAVTIRNILRLALYEMLYHDDVPPPVSINEAIEMAKVYQDSEASRFVNGILDKIRKST